MTIEDARPLVTSTRMERAILRRDSMVIGFRGDSVIVWKLAGASSTGKATPTEAPMHKGIAMRSVFWGTSLLCVPERTF